jgi:hypothetical protein
MWKHVKKGANYNGNYKSSPTESKLQKTSLYACHIYGLNGHKMTDCPKFTEMQKMFHGKFVTRAEVRHVAKRQTIIANVMWWMLMFK